MSRSRPGPGARWTWRLLGLGAVAVVGVLAMTGLPGDRAPVQVRSVAAEGTTLTITYLGRSPECDAAPGVDVEEDDAQVVVTVSLSLAPDGDCPAVARLATVDVELDQPLGDRVAVDGRNGQQVETVRPSAG